MRIVLILLFSWTLRSSNRAPHGLLFVLWWRKRLPKPPPPNLCVCVCVGLFSGFYVLAFLLQWHFQFINQTKKEKKRVNLFMSLIQQRKRCKSILKPDVQCFRWHWRWWTKLDFSFSIKKSFTSDRIIKNSKVIHGKQSFPEQSIFKLMAILLHKVIKNTKVLTW